MFGELESGKPLGEAFTLFARIEEKKFLEEMEEKIQELAPGRFGNT